MKKFKITASLKPHKFSFGDFNPSDENVAAVALDIASQNGLGLLDYEYDKEKQY